ncbi:DUF2169 family type VI secretion system accessory protein [Granulosicoccus sp. 3-233]|uniref:DUF2169 family type VI secretion system accessory protein n=1 Tax=Granulosicoccus sp. 3-233 TaxID=3417969 RepID=UPI003D344EF5
MQLINHTPLLAGCTQSMAPNGQESLVVAIKGSFSIPATMGKAATLLEQQLPLLESDRFLEQPGFSSPLYEADYAPFKSRCDVTVVGSAYAPAGKASECVAARLELGQISKRLHVLGDRHWVANASGFSISQPETFEVRAITYDIAFGGTDSAHEDVRMHGSYLANPIGIGFHKSIDATLVDGSPAPSTEEPGIPVLHPNGVYRPMSLGPIARGWSPRIDYAGTYDDDWMDERFPFLPQDFDTRFYQSTLEDQQCDYLVGGEIVRLTNLTPQGHCEFTVPVLEVPVCFFRRKSQRLLVKAVIDTLVIEPDEQRFSLVWRTRLPLRRNLFEVPEVRIGTASAGRNPCRVTPMFEKSHPSDQTVAGKPLSDKP